MKNLNHAKIIQAVEKAVQAGHEEFIYDFLKAYGKAKTTINRLKRECQVYCVNSVWR